MHVTQTTLCSFGVAIDIANVLHLGLWTSSNSSVASSLAWRIINLLFRCGSLHVRVGLSVKCVGGLVEFSAQKQ